MRRRLALTAIGATVLALAGGTVTSVATAAPAGAALLPKVIALPDGYQPEGIATKGATFYVGSVADGAIVRGNVLTGRVTPFVAGTPGDDTTGLEVSGNLLFAAGAGTGTLKVYDLRTGREQQIRALLQDGLPLDVVADRLMISRRTVESHQRNLYKKLGIHRRDQLAASGPDHHPDERIALTTSSASRMSSPTATAGSRRTRRRWTG